MDFPVPSKPHAVRVAVYSLERQERSQTFHSLPFFKERGTHDYRKRWHRLSKEHNILTGMGSMKRLGRKGASCSA